MKIIVTGGAGFIGSHLVKKLVNKKHNVIIIDNFSNGRKKNLGEYISKVKILNIDISKKGKWLKNLKNVDVVFHLAGLADIVPSIQNPLSYFESNVTGTANLLTSSIDYKVKKFIYASSASCYGIAKKLPTKENSKLSVEYPYALTKKMGEDLVTHWSKVYNIETVSLRLFNVYGPNSRTSGTYGAMFGTFLAQKIANKPYTVVGNGEQKRDFTYIDDVINAFYKSINLKGSHIFNVGTGKPTTINHIVKCLEGNKINVPKRPGEPDETRADITKIKKIMKWRPQVTIEKGIKNLLKDIDYWKDAPVWTKSKIKKATKDWFKYLGKNGKIK